MHRLAPSLCGVFLLALAATAQPGKPVLPRVPLGFDEGRTAFTEEAGEERVLPGALVERLFEQADLQDLAGFIHAHMLSDEKQALGQKLGISGLANAKDETAVVTLLGKHEPKDVSSAIGAVLVARKYLLTDVGAWLYSRGINFRTLQRAMNGERLDAWRLRRQLRAMKDRSAGAVFIPGLWEYNLNDSREEKGGIYDGVQLVDCLLALGWGPADFARAAGVKELPDARRKLVEWGDPALLWRVIEAYVSESELVARAVAHYKAKDDPKVLELALARAATTLRWLRTGGPGVVGVYRGPWPDAGGKPAPPTGEAAAIGDVDAEQFAEALSETLLGHFSGKGDKLTLVVYDDGSARAILDKPARDPLIYTPDTPFGATTTTRQPYEGRVSFQGRNGLFFLVYGAGIKSAPQEVEFSNVKLSAGGAFFLADIDDGLNLTPILLRRISPLSE